MSLSLVEFVTNERENTFLLYSEQSVDLPL